MAGKTITAKSAATTAATATGYVTIASTTGWYVGAKGSITQVATGTLTSVGNFLNTETVTIGTKVYTFQTVLTNVNGNVLIGATASDSLDNLIAAINLGAGSGTTYAALTTLNTDVTAAAGAGDTMVITAKVPGTAANSIATTDTAASSSWGGVVMSGGLASLSIVIAEVPSATSLGVRILPDSVVGTVISGPNYGRSDMTGYSAATIYQHEQFIFNYNDFPLP